MAGEWHGRSMLCVKRPLSYADCKLPAPYYVSSVSCMDRPYFSKLTHKRQDFRNKFLACISCLSATLSEKSLILRIIQADTVKNVIGEAPLFLQDLNEN